MVHEMELTQSPSDCHESYSRNQGMIALHPSRRRATIGYLVLAVSPLVLFAHSASSFVLTQTQNKCGLSHPKRHLPLSASNDPDEISRQLERAREVLAKSKAKIEASKKSSDDKSKSALPFFATRAVPNKKDKVIKSQNEETGLFTTDGDLMAKLSENEEWESRPLLEVFQNENEDESSSNSQLAERDVAASIYNLQKTLRTEDYREIFNPRNRFIGEN